MPVFPQNKHSSEMPCRALLESHQAGSRPGDNVYHLRGSPVYETHIMLTVHLWMKMKQRS